MTISNTSALDIGDLHQEMDDAWDSIFEAYRMISASGNGTMLDYGSGLGAWSLYATQVFDQVYGADIDEDSLHTARSLAARNDIDNVSFFDLKDLNAADLPPLDSMISIMVIELARSSEVVDMFEFAAKNLKPGGRFLCMSRRPVGFLRTLLFLERFRWEGIFKGARRTAASMRSALESLVNLEIQSVPRARFYHRPQAVIGLGERVGLQLEAGPGQLAGLPAFDQLDRHCSRHWFFNLRQTDWYIFKKPEDSS